MEVTPPRAPRAGRRGALAAVLLLLAAPALLRADYRDDYKHGLDALQQRRWEEAARDFRQAIAARPEASGIMGGLFRRYTPQYYLGVALAEQGDCRAALDAFDTAERQGKLSHDDTADIQRRRQTCRQRIAAVAEVATQAQREIDAAAAVAQQVAALQASPVLRAAWGEGSPSLEARQQAAASRLAGARAALDRAQQQASKEQAEEASRSAQQARRDLEALLADATARRAAVQQQAQRELQELHRAADAARKDVAFANKTFAPLPPALAEKCRQVEAAIAPAAAADATTPLGDLRKRQEALRQATRELRVAVKPPPEALQKAAATYFDGDYAATLAALSALPAGDARAEAHACLLRAAALHAAYLLQGDGGPGLEAAKAEIRRCQSLPSPVAPPPGAFPPSFAALWQELAAARP